MKLIIVGEGGVGKSTYRELLENKAFKERHVPTLGLETVDISYKGTDFTIWDTSGTEKFAGLREGYYIGAHCAIIMISDSKLSYQSFGSFKSMIIRTCGNIPIVVVVNKNDLFAARSNYNNLKFRESNLISISCKDQLSIYEPLDRLINLLK